MTAPARGVAAWQGRSRLRVPRERVAARRSTTRPWHAWAPARARANRTGRPRVFRWPHTPRRDPPRWCRTPSASGRGRRSPAPAATSRLHQTHDWTRWWRARRRSRC